MAPGQEANDDNLDFFDPLEIMFCWVYSLESP